jgi:hypothetical protein
LPTIVIPEAVCGLGRASVSLALNPPIYFMLAPVVRLQ